MSLPDQKYMNHVRDARVKGVLKTYHCGGRIVYHRRDDRGPYGRWSGDCLGAREDGAGVT